MRKAKRVLCEACEGKTEVTPPGFENVVKSLKTNPDVAEPYAVAWSMHQKGYKPTKEDGTPYDPQSMLRRFMFERKSREASEKKESNSSSALGQLMRKGLMGKEMPKGEMKESHRHLCESHPMRWFSPLREGGVRPTGQGPAGDGRAVILINVGKGNSEDRNLYTDDALRESAGAFEGTKCFLDHPSETEEEDLPERSVRDVAGWFSDVKFDENLQAIVGILNPGSNAAGQELAKLREDTMQYQKQYPGRDPLVGLSIDADGEAEEAEVDGEKWNRVQKITRARSVDLVTYPARGGRMLESARGWRRQFEHVIEECSL